MIYINGRFLSQPMRGIPRFSYEMCLALQALGLDFTVIVPQHILPVYQLPFQTIRYGKLKSHLWEQIDLLRFLKSHHNPLLISFSGLGPVFYKNHMATVHDLSFMHEPRWFSRSYNLIYNALTPLLVKNAKKILTVSHFSKQEIIKYLKTNPDKIDVIYNALSDAFLPPELPDRVQSPEEKYILAVSSHDPRKNFIRIIHAFRELNLPDVKLYIAGNVSGVFNHENMDKYNTENIRILGFVSDEELSYYYRHAQLFIYPSLYEGFGIPPLEAQANGCPAVVSHIPALEEIYGDSVACCDPYNISSIAAKMREVIENEELRNTLIRKGYEKIRRYSWKQSAQKVCKIIQSCTDNE